MCKVAGTTGVSARGIPCTGERAFPGRRHTHAMRQGLDRFSEQFDDVFRGLDPAPKFPRPSVLSFLLRSFHSQGAMPRGSAQGGGIGDGPSNPGCDVAKRGGIHDHLAGFHRYAVDRQWHVCPHFEKMLYDQAQLAVVYEALSIPTNLATPGGACWDLDYVLRDMTSAEGGFYSAEDADSLVSPDSPEAQGEGAFYLWEGDGQIDRALPESAQWFKRFYGRALR